MKENSAKEKAVARLTRCEKLNNQFLLTPQPLADGQNNPNPGTSNIPSSKLRRPATLCTGTESNPK